MACEENLHHLVPKSILECVFGLRGSQAREREASEENILYTWDIGLHDTYHALFGGRTVMSVHEDAPLLYKTFTESGSSKRRSDPVKINQWHRLFGPGAHPEEARAKLRTLIWFYLFGVPGERGRKSSRRNEVFSAQDLRENGHLLRVYRDLVPQSYFKQHAWDILFGYRASYDRARELLPSVYAGLQPFDADQ